MFCYSSSLVMGYIEIVCHDFALKIICFAKYSYIEREILLKRYDIITKETVVGSTETHVIVSSYYSFRI